MLASASGGSRTDDRRRDGGHTVSFLASRSRPADDVKLRLSLRDPLVAAPDGAVGEVDSTPARSTSVLASIQSPTSALRAMPMDSCVVTTYSADSWACLHPQVKAVSIGMQIMHAAMHGRPETAVLSSMRSPVMKPCGVFFRSDRPARERVKRAASSRSPGVRRANDPVRPGRARRMFRLPWPESSTLWPLASFRK